MTLKIQTGNGNNLPLFVDQHFWYFQKPNAHQKYYTDHYKLSTHVSGRVSPYWASAPRVARCRLWTILVLSWYHLSTLYAQPTRASTQTRLRQPQVRRSKINARKSSSTKVISFMFLFVHSKTLLRSERQFNLIWADRWESDHISSCLSADGRRRRQKYWSQLPFLVEGKNQWCPRWCRSKHTEKPPRRNMDFLCCAVVWR